MILLLVPGQVEEVMRSEMSDERSCWACQVVSLLTVLGGHSWYGLEWTLYLAREGWGLEGGRLIGSWPWKAWH